MWKMKTNKLETAAENNNGKRNESVPSEAYYDRNLVVQALAKLAMDQGLNVGIRQDKEWLILYIDLPTGQVSWHIPASELIGEFPEYNGKWDGHDLDQKRDRIKKFIAKGSEINE
jgi:hypothetical protein